MAINLNYSEEQALLAETAHDFFERHCPPALVRNYDGAAEEFPHELWRQMADLGWLGMGFAPDYDGLGCSFLDMYPLYIEMGRRLAPTPHLETVALAGELVSRLGSEAQKRAMLPSIASGAASYSLAVLEPMGGYGPRGVQLAARPAAGGGFSLDGVKAPVAYAGEAAGVLVAARTAPGDGEAGVSLFLVDPNAKGVARERLPNTAGLPLYALTFDDVAVAASDVLGPVSGAWPALHETMLKAAVLQSAMVIGAGEHVLDMSVNYAKERVQYGEPIGKHQAVQYLVTDIAIQLDQVRLLALHAAWRIDSGQSFVREASLAKAAASKAAAAMTFAAHEVHAGIGFMKDYDLQLYTRRAKHWEFNLGDYRHSLETGFAAHETPPHFTGFPLKAEAQAKA